MNTHVVFSVFFLRQGENFKIKIDMEKGLSKVVAEFLEFPVQILHEIYKRFVC